MFITRIPNPLLKYSPHRAVDHILPKCPLKMPVHVCRRGTIAVSDIRYGAPEERDFHGAAD
jgi:hypothetical protein